MKIVTGGAGFIGSNIVRALNKRGETDIVLIEDLHNGRKVSNLSDLKFIDFVDKESLAGWLNSLDDYSDIECVYHLGACTDTTEWNGVLMMKENFEASKTIYQFCAKFDVPLVYASSAAVYGLTVESEEIDENERPLNIYGFSKLMFDNFVRNQQKKNNAAVVGLRFFNVYGPFEQQKGPMASVISHFNEQIIKTKKIKVFKASHGYADGMHSRDFVYVDDVVKVALWFGDDKARKRGIYNCGAGLSTPFREVAEEVLKWHGFGEIDYVDFPPNLKSAYQPYTLANLDKLRAVGYSDGFTGIDKGIREYLTWINS